MENIFNQDKSFKINKKAKPLLLRLNDALELTSSENEIKKVYDLLGRYTKKIKKYSKDEFYSNLNQKTLNANYIEGEIYLNNEYLNNGQKISKILKNRISLPKAGTHNYKHNLIEIMDSEYKLIQKYYEDFENDK